MEAKCNVLIEYKWLYSTNCVLHCTTLLMITLQKILALQLINWNCKYVVDIGGKLSRSLKTAMVAINGLIAVSFLNSTWP